MAFIKYSVTTLGLEEELPEWIKKAQQAKVKEDTEVTTETLETDKDLEVE